jgi:hypothetical protein
VFSPNGGEVIASGSSDQSIEWGAPEEAVSFNLLYSGNNGLTWKTIESGIAGSDYPWNVPLQTANKTKCKIKVIGYNSSGAKVDEDVSDAPFTIEVLKVTYPDGGEILGQTDYIRWKFNETLTPVQKIILYSSVNGGTTWQKIRTLESGPYLPGDYEERVEVVPRLNKTSTTSRIKIVLKDKAGKTLGTDISDAFFTIAIP